MPLWLAPVQVVAATITNAANDYANEVMMQLQAAGLRVDIDIRNEKINYKVREHSEAKVPVILALGEREAAQKSVSIRAVGKQRSNLWRRRLWNCKPKRHRRHNRRHNKNKDGRAQTGEMAERLNAADLKSAKGANSSGVRIPLSPPVL